MMRNLKQPEAQGHTIWYLLNKWFTPNNLKPSHVSSITHSLTHPAIENTGLHEVSFSLIFMAQTMPSETQHHMLLLLFFLNNWFTSCNLKQHHMLVFLLLFF